MIALERGPAFQNIDPSTLSYHDGKGNGAGLKYNMDSGPRIQTFGGMLFDTVVELSERTGGIFPIVVEMKELQRGIDG